MKKERRRNLKETAVDSVFGLAFVGIVFATAWLCARVSGCC